MNVRFVDASGAHERPSDDIVTLLTRDDGFVWVDVPAWDDEAVGLLQGLGCHPMVIEACRQRNHVPTVHSYGEQDFVTTQSPLLGHAGHVHLLELDQILGPNFLVTVHGPINPAVDVAEALVETEGALRRIQSGRFHPSSPAELSYAVTSAVARRQRALISEVAEKLPDLEQLVMESPLTEPEELLERLFLIRHELIATRTMASQCCEVWARLAGLARLVDAAEREYARDLADQFQRVRSIADGEAQFLVGVIELYHTRVNTKMTVAMERLAVIAAITLPITAVASIEGMNMIIAVRENLVELGVVLVIMAAMSAWLLRWARRQGWW
ncbi:MAG TPA: magnesium transporter CorA family protein [Nocardioidaceae bacterium]